MRGLEGLLVAAAAQDREDAPVRVDELERPLEELRLGQEVHLAAQVDGHEEVVEEGEVVGRDDHGPVRGHVVRVDAAGPVDDAPGRA